MSQSIDDLIQKVSLYAPDLVLTRPDAIVFTFEATRYMGLCHTMEKVTGLYPVKNGQICLPVNAMRVLSVGRDCAGCQPYTNAYQRGRFIRFQGWCDLPTEVLVSHTSIPVDEAGEPDVGDALEDVCFWWVMRAKTFLPRMQGKVPQDVREEIKSSLGNAMRQARADFRFISNDELRDLAALLRQPVISFHS